MRVNPNSELVGVTRTPRQTGAGDPRLGADQLSLTNAERLTHALEQTPATRAEKVTQAQSMIEDVTYPPPELIRKIAALFAMNVDAAREPDRGTSD
jgi:hypothetical protein